MSANISQNADPTMSAIRSILHDDMPTESPKRRSKGRPAKANFLRSAVDAKTKFGARQPTVAAKAEEQLASHAQPNAAIEQPARLAAPMFGLGRKHFYIVAFAVIGLTQPQWIITPLIIFAFLSLGAFAIFGADRTWAGVIRVFKRFAERSPSDASYLAERLDAFAMRWDRFLDRFPEGSVDGMYLPDFQSVKLAKVRSGEVSDARRSGVYTHQ